MPVTLAVAIPIIVITVATAASPILPIVAIIVATVAAWHAYQRFRRCGVPCGVGGAVAHRIHASPAMMRTLGSQPEPQVIAAELRALDVVRAVAVAQAAVPLVA
ncbi:MAG: hypothetical protein ACRD5G_03225, partial [Candidatus Acidiferrales bacterium]